MMEIEKLIKDLTIEEKAALVSGTDFMYTNAIPRLGIPSLCTSDGPHGLRKQADSKDNGVSKSEPATDFPTAVTTASSWNPDNTYRMGQAIAEECKHYGVHVLLGPGVNIKRNPLCGRNFEYFSEDPVLAGKMGAAMVEGVQSKGVGVSVKHFALNNTENNRFLGNSVASERTIRELYLKPFEYIVKKAKPATLMCAYNQINGTFCSENKWLLTDVLREEWGFDGLVMTDWGAIKDRVKAITAGLDLEMPGDTAYCRRMIIDAAYEDKKNGTTEFTEKLDEACRNILTLVDTYVCKGDSSRPEVDWEVHHALAADIAADSAVLMKNEHVLPLQKTEKIAVIGSMFTHMRYQGAGSSMINPAILTQPKDVFERMGVKACAPEDADKILVFVGLTDDIESEGCDRENMQLPQESLADIEKALSYGKKVIVVLFGGAVVELPFADRVDAILNMFLPGQNGGTAVYKLLFGEVNPSGRLSETWPIRYEDVPSHADFGKHVNEIYEEGTEIGYRYFSRHDIPVRYPFGHGLSYTSFSQTEWIKEGTVYRKTITNTGDRFGGEVAMLFVDERLRGFRKVYLEPGASTEVSIDTAEDAGIFDVDYSNIPDTYEKPKEPEKLPLHVESRFTDFQQTFMGRILYNAVLGVSEKQRRDALKMPEGPERENKLKGALFLKRILDSNSVRTLSMSGGKAFPYNFALGFVDLANGHLFKGAMCFAHPIKVPKLPKDE